MVHSNHGTICSCVGPVIDVQMKSKVFYKEKCMITQMSWLWRYSARDVFAPSVYDAFLVLRPSCNFRDGTVIKNYVLNQAQYFIELPFHDGYLMGLIHLCCADYRSEYHGSNVIPSMCEELGDMNLRDIVLGFASVFLLVKSYSNCLVAELSGCYKGVLRAIALGSTDGLCTFSCTFSLSFQPVIVPVGRIALGRILNVVGSSIDPYIDLSLSSQFCSYHFHVLSGVVESDPNESYPVTYPNHIICPAPIELNASHGLIRLWNTVIVNTINAVADYRSLAWIFYLACLCSEIYGFLHLSTGTPSLSVIGAYRISANKTYTQNTCCNDRT